MLWAPRAPVHEICRERSGSTAVGGELIRKQDVGSGRR
jgi:hypothetical protein